MKNHTAIAIAAVLIVSGCAAPDSGNYNNSGSAGQSAAAGAAIGAVAGCALAAVIGKKCAEGAAAGALLGAAVGYSSYSEKVATAQTVNAEARREGLTVPNDELRLKDYQLRTSSAVARAGGAPLHVIGDIKLYGQSRRVPDVVQSMTLLTASGERASDKPQVAKVERIDGAGQFRAVGVYKIPKGMEQGRYTVQSVLLLDGREVARRSTGFQVAQADAAAPALALAD